MAIVALLSAHHSIDGAEPWGSLVVGGLPIVGRQMRQANLAGVQRTLVKVEGTAPDSLASLVPNLVIVRDGLELAEAIGTDDVLLFAEGLVIDDRIVQRMLEFDGAALAVWSGQAPSEAERIDHETCWAGLARIPADVAASAGLTLGDWDMQSTLLRVASALGPARLDIGSVGHSATARVTADHPLWITVRSPQDALLMTEQLLQAGRISGGTWALRYIQAPVAIQLTRWLLPTRITPFMLRILDSSIGVAAMLAVASGWLVAGLALAICFGCIGQTAEKLARVRLQLLSQSAGWDLMDRVIGYAWFVSLGSWLAGLATTGLPLLLAVTLILFAVAAAMQRSYIFRLSGQYLHDFGPFERRLGLVSAEPLTLVWMMLPFYLFGYLLAGLAALTAYACLIFFISQARIFQRLGEATTSKMPHRFDHDTRG